MNYELPPQVQSTGELAALRDYLVRLSQSLEKIADGAASVTLTFALDAPAEVEFRAQASEGVRLCVREIRYRRVRPANA